MRPNKFGNQGVEERLAERSFCVLLGPPVSLQKAGLFRHTMLGTDFDIAGLTSSALPPASKCAANLDPRQACQSKRFFPLS